MAYEGSVIPGPIPQIGLGGANQSRFGGTKTTIDAQAETATGTIRQAISDANALIDRINALVDRLVGDQLSISASSGKGENPSPAGTFPHLADLSRRLQSRIADTHIALHRIDAQIE